MTGQQTHFGNEQTSTDGGWRNIHITCTLHPLFAIRTSNKPAAQEHHQGMPPIPRYFIQYMLAIHEPSRRTEMHLGPLRASTKSTARTTLDTPRWVQLQSLSVHACPALIVFKWTRGQRRDTLRTLAETTCPQSGARVPTLEVPHPEAAG